MRVEENFSKLSRTLAQVFFVLSLIFIVAGCEDTESYEGVTFKPAQADSKYLDTSVSQADCLDLLRKKSAIGLFKALDLVMFPGKSTNYLHTNHIFLKT